MGTLANSEDPDEMPHVAFHLGLHCLLRQNRSSEKNKQYFGEEIITFDPSIYTMDQPAFIVYSFMENSVGLKWWDNLNYLPDSHNFMASQTFSGSSPEVNSFTTSPAKLRHWKIVIWVSIDSFNVIVFISACRKIDNNFDVVSIVVGTKLTAPYTMSIELRQDLPEKKAS